jgi:hypothetical protein
LISSKIVNVSNWKAVRQARMGNNTTEVHGQCSTCCRLYLLLLY